MAAFQEVVRVLRNLRAEARVTPQTFVNRAVVQCGEESFQAAIVRETAPLMQELTRIREISILPLSAEKPAGALSSQLTGGEVSLIVGDILDIASEIARLSEEIASITKNMQASSRKLENEDFVRRAPSDVVEKERLRLEEGEARLRRIHENIESLKRS
jgi:valyl-tRNA synthetase